MNSSERLCLWCKYFIYEETEVFSEDTYNVENIRCDLGFWPSILWGQEIHAITIELYNLYKLAEKCPHFELKGELIQLVNKNV
jgi:hypothetical protein